MTKEELLENLKGALKESEINVAGSLYDRWPEGFTCVPKDIWMSYIYAPFCNEEFEKYRSEFICRQDWLLEPEKDNKSLKGFKRTYLWVKNAVSNFIYRLKELFVDSGLQIKEGDITPFTYIFSLALYRWMSQALKHISMGFHQLGVVALVVMLDEYHANCVRWNFEGNAFKFLSISDFYKELDESLEIILQLSIAHLARSEGEHYALDIVKGNMSPDMSEKFEDAMGDMVNSVKQAEILETEYQHLTQAAACNSTTIKRKSISYMIQQGYIVPSTSENPPQGNWKWWALVQVWAKTNKSLGIPDMGYDYDETNGGMVYPMRLSPSDRAWINKEFGLVYTDKDDAIIKTKLARNPEWKKCYLGIEEDNELTSLCEELDAYLDTLTY